MQNLETNILEKTNTIINIKNLTKSYENQSVFKNLNFDIKGSEIFVILGKSGAGKSSLMNIIAKLDDDYSGEVIYNENLYVDKKVPFPIVFQEFDQLLPWYTVKKNILLPLKRKELDKNILEVIEFVGLSDDLDKYPSTLSGGMKQRAAIARALLCDGDIIFMDEPFGSLDFLMRKNLQSLIKNIKTKYGKTIVFITHDIEEAIFIADRVMLYKESHEIEIIDISKIDKENAQSKSDMTRHIKDQLTL